MPYKLHDMKKERENFVAKITYRPISEPIAMLLSKTNITPNQVSFMSVVSSIVAGIFFSLGEWLYLVIGYIFLQLTYLLDHVDGNLARYTGRSDEFGKWVDEITNKPCKFFLVLGVSIGLFRMTNNTFYLILGSIAVFNWFYSAYISETKTKFEFKSSKKSKTSFGQFLNQMLMPITVFNIFGLLILINKADLALWFVSIVSLIYIKHIYSTRKLWRKKHYS